jgi:hypothetical protein
MPGAFFRTKPKPGAVLHFKHRSQRMLRQNQELGGTDPAKLLQTIFRSLSLKRAVFHETRSYLLGR